MFAYVSRQRSQYVVRDLEERFIYFYLFIYLFIYSRCPENNGTNFPLKFFIWKEYLLNGKRSLW